MSSAVLPLDAVSLQRARARLERRQAELRRLLDEIDTEPSGEHPISFATAAAVSDPFECQGIVEDLELRAVERALERLLAGAFGACELCGGPIERARLDAVPWSRCCTSCISFWEGVLRTIDPEPASCADCLNDTGDRPPARRTRRRRRCRRAA
jgi:DnaK suppressor protein